jgi:nucleoid-associated protein YgaU
VEVQPGDSLWSITRRALGPGATEERIAQTWPAWWSANRSVVGDDPGLIHPGDRLTAP